METVRARLRVRGLVQGVGFRYFLAHTARQLGLRGYVQNCPDGSVEAVVEGSRDAVERVIAHARIGPPAARVQTVEVHWEAPTGEFASFEIRRTV